MFDQHDLQAFIIDREKPVDDVREFLAENCTRITRQQWTGQYSERHVVLDLVFGYLAKSDADLRAWIEEQTQHLPEASLHERIYALVSGEPNSCQVSQKTKTFNARKHQYNFCGKYDTCECARKNFHALNEGKSKEEKQETNRRRRTTMLERHGVEHQSQSEELNGKRLQTNLERYGAESPLANQAVREKIRETNRERFGTDYPLGNTVVQTKRQETSMDRYGVPVPILSPEFHKHLLQTNLERYGSASPFGNPEVRAKAQETIRERYGAENAMANAEIRAAIAMSNQERFGGPSPFSSPEVQVKTHETLVERYGPDYQQHLNETRRETIRERFGSDSPFGDAGVREKARQTIRGRYGVDNVFANASVIEQIYTTNVERYGSRYPAQRNYTHDTFEVLGSATRLKTLIEEKSIATIADELNVHRTTVEKYCDQYGIILPSSTYETELHTLLRENNIAFDHNTRKVITPRELDVFIPERQVAIEFNGLYWHSEQFVDRLYHFDKWKACRDHGIRLLMINEDEWLHNPQAIKLKILHTVGKGERGKGARHHLIRTITGREGLDFTELHHIQGAPTGVTISLGAFLNDVLSAVILFNRQRSTGDLELIRFCSNGPAYPGLFSKMFTHFIRESPDIDHVISFADRRYSEGNVYETCGFNHVGDIAPDYRYVIGNRTFHKSTFTKSKIAKRFGLDMSSMTEHEAMLGLGHYRIYDCGKIKYEWRRS